MSYILTAVTIATIAICGPEKETIVENIEVTKPSTSAKETIITFKKEPTKWVKTTKNSN